MTITKGNSESLVDVWVPEFLTEDRLYHSNAQFVDETVVSLLGELQSPDIVFDADEGIVSFTHSNPAHKTIHGTDRAERDLLDWIGLKMFEMGLPEIAWDFMPLIINGLHKQIRETNG